MCKFHNEIDTPNLKTSWEMSSEEPAYKAWETKAKLVHRYMNVKGLTRRQVTDGSVENEEQSNRRYRASEHEQVAAQKLVIYETAKAWSESKYAVKQHVAAKILNTMESKSVAETLIDARGWMMKFQMPSVSIPVPMKKLLVSYFNEKIKVSPEGALVRLLALPEYRMDVFMQYVMTAGRVRGYFAQLKKYKDKKNLGSQGKVPEAFAVGGESTQDFYIDKSDGDKRYGSVKDLVRLILKRGISAETKSKLKKYGKEILVAMLVCDDEKEMDKADGDNVSDELFDEMCSEFHMQYSGLEYEDEGGDDGDELTGSGAVNEDYENDDLEDWMCEAVED